MIKIKNHIKSYSRYTFLTFFIIIIIVSLLIIKPFLPAIILGVIVAYIFYPLYSRLNSKIKNVNLCAIISTLLVLLLVTVPLIFFFTTLTKEVTLFYSDTKERVSSDDMLIEEGRVFVVMYGKIQEWIINPKLKYYFEDAVSKASSSVIDFSSNVLISIPKLLLNLLIMIFIIFFTFKEGDETIKRLIKMLPLKTNFKKDLTNQTRDVIFATVYGTVIVAIIQGLLALICFMIFGVASPILWALLTIFAALIPFVGTALIWLPISLLFIVEGSISSNPSVLWKGIGIIIYGILIISSADNILKPKIIGRKANIHPLLVLLGIFGGIGLMGFIGLIVGPLVLALLVSFIRVYERDRGEIIN